MINLHTKSEAYIHYEDMKGNAKCRNWVVWEVTGISSVNFGEDIFAQKMYV